MLKRIFDFTRLMLEILGAVFCRTCTMTNGRTAHTTAQTLPHAGKARGSHASLLKIRAVMKFFRVRNNTRVLPSGMFGAEGRRGVTRISRRSRSPCAKGRKPIRSPASAFGGECAMRTRRFPAGLAAISEFASGARFRNCSDRSYVARVRQTWGAPLEFS
ncbi:MAG: hypothetical protein MSG64_04130 [Pyrinomonadaceae bacterium MAG19_C2-C3]|nr:hypothetical protein [Pyrinomonadaceae bacterium MAG19_C2-C3]